MSQRRVAVKPAKGRKYAAKTLSIPPDLLQWADAQADASGRTRSRWIAWALGRIREGKDVPLEEIADPKTEMPAASEPASEHPHIKFPMSQKASSTKKGAAAKSRTAGVESRPTHPKAE